MTGKHSIYDISDLKNFRDAAIYADTLRDIHLDRSGLRRVLVTLDISYDPDGGDRFGFYDSTGTPLTKLENNADVKFHNGTPGVSIFKDFVVIYECEGPEIQQRTEIVFIEMFDGGIERVHDQHTMKSFALWLEENAEYECVILVT